MFLLFYLVVIYFAKTSPIQVAPRHNRTFKNMFVRAEYISPCFNFQIVSYENEEKVVNPPKIPTAMKTLMLVEITTPF